MARHLSAVLIASGLVLTCSYSPSSADDAPTPTCLAEAQQLELSTNKLPEGALKDKVLKRLHKAENAAETDPNSTDCRHYLQRAKAGLGME